MTDNTNQPLQEKPPEKQPEQEAWYLGIFPSRSAAKAFGVMLLSFALIQAAALFVFVTYLSMNEHRLTTNELANEVVKVNSIVQAVPALAVPKLMDTLNQRGLHISLTKKPLPKSIHLIQDMKSQKIRQLVHKHVGNLRLSLALDNSNWLNIWERRTTHPWLFAGFAFTLMMLFVALVLTSDWIVRYLAVPLTKFAKAAERFGLDVQAPPLSEAGAPETREAIKAFNQMQDRLRRLLHDRTQMLAAISHDLRTPITRLKLRAEFIKEEDQYNKVVEDLNEMDHMISSILAFARDYNQEETMQRFDLEALLETLCDNMIDMGRDVTYAGVGERLPFFGRISALKRAFTNVIDNAIKYGQSAAVSLVRQGDEVQIKVLDQGPGIPDAEKENVFNPFYRVNAARSPSPSGTGLGLAVSRDIIRAHGGEIGLHNQSDPRGLLLVITLPVKALGVDQ